jgi:mono/diheme cytochrome c family protein
MSSLRSWSTLALLVAVSACGRSPDTHRQDTSAPSSAPAASVVSLSSAAPTAALGDAVRGKALAGEFECWRCHSDNRGGGEGLFGRGDQSKDCTGCHQWIADGAPGGEGSHPPGEVLIPWQKSSAKLKDTPSLLGVNRYRRAWVERFLVEPFDVRPGLVPTMPRLPISPEQARDLAAWLATATGKGVDPADDITNAAALAGADLACGRQLIEERSCGSCHVFTGVPALKARPPTGAEPPPAIALAPDLRYARDRLDAPALLAWLDNPAAIRPQTSMPRFSFSREEARDVAAYLLGAELAPLAPRAVPARLPLLTRPVRYDEVNRKVFHRVCRHCHGEPDLALGDGGPGNTGGFGFAPRGLNLAEYEAIASGALDDHGERRSIFAAMSGGTPRLLRALLARQSEEANRPDPEVRGMPLGLPSLSPEDIQLVETWIAQQHAR